MRAREQQRRGIYRSTPKSIHRHRATKAGQRLPTQLVQIESGAARFRNRDDEIVARGTADH
jgi:hypothetical protein